MRYEGWVFIYVKDNISWFLWIKAKLDGKIIENYFVLIIIQNISCYLLCVTMCSGIFIKIKKFNLTQKLI